MRLRRNRESGATLVEVAFILPLLLTLAIGMAEIGFLVVDMITATNAARSGARTGAALGPEATTDTAILDVVEEDLCNLKFLDAGEKIVIRIFKANADGSMSSSANNLSATPPLNCGTVGHSFSCDALEGGCNWAPTSRNNTPPSNFDQLGVRIEFSHEWFSNWIPFPEVTLAESAVMQLEPDTSN